MINKDFIDGILELSKPTELMYNGINYLSANKNRQLIQIIPPAPDALKLSTLQSLIDFTNAQDIDPYGLLIHVASETQVDLYSLLDTTNQARRRYCSVNIIFDGFPFGRTISNEKFIVYLQSTFKPHENNELLLKLAGNIKQVNEAGFTDDGISQTVTAKTGIVKVENVKIPNPITLKPIRTFPEVDQPVSDFVVRIKDGIEWTLHEADGGAWKLEAIKNIAKWLRAKSDIPILA